ncbi:hypothetical protein [Allorhizocola rhizosphaerae]|uniref:hypothetical protein n=1 Tax=Allorhizocola rhizosphaerae TaxID=1872709 RepID=UPI000E3E15B5|nr:hypothetical protein [Allorhizocola rhizosphaerae]
MDPELRDFMIYVGALGLSGLLLLVLAALGIGNRAINGIIGLAAAGYAGFLLYKDFTATEPYEYQKFFFAYIMPFIALYLLVKGIMDRRKAAAQG